MKIKTYLINILIFLLVVYITQIFVFQKCIKYFWKIQGNVILIQTPINNIVFNNSWENNIIKTIKISVDNKTWDNTIENFDYFKYNGKQYLVRKSNNDNIIWANFISYKIVNWHYYFYAHNWPISNYFIWDYINKTIKIWDIIKLGNLNNKNEKKYKLYNIETIKETNNSNKNLKFENNNDILFFTCVKYWKERKIFLFKEI